MVPGLGSQTAWAASGNVLQTSDAGQSWQKVTLATQSYLSHIAIPDAQTIYFLSNAPPG